MTTLTPAATTSRPTLLEHTITPSGAFTVLLRAGRELTLTAGGDDACASTFVLGTGSLAHDRLNLPDTLKAQHSAVVRPPMVLMSDLGLGLASVTGSSLDWHDALGGHSTDAHLARHVPTSYESHRNERYLSARHGVLSELRKHGRDEQDLHASVNFFAKVATSSDDAGTLRFVPGHSHEGDWVTLRSELDLLVVVSASQHPLDPREVWAPAPVHLAVTASEPVRPDDPSYTHRPESARALDASRRVFA